VKTREESKGPSSSPGIGYVRSEGVNSEVRERLLVRPSVERLVLAQIAENPQ
jgi:hypothetical protein